MNFDFSGKRALVTGGGRGIGREIAESLVRCGAKTFVLTKWDNSLESMQRENPDIEVTVVDLTDWDRAKKAVVDVLPIDILVNNAAIFRLAPFIDFTESDIDNIFSINYKAPFNISQIVARDLISRKKPGSIVNISSFASMKRTPAASVYGSTKAALDSLTKYMAQELGRQQIRVNAINPTGIPTDMIRDVIADPVAKQNIINSIPLGRLGEKREVADVALFLLSDRASLVNGVTMPVDGGHVL